MATKKATRKKTTKKSSEPTKDDLMEEAQDLDVEGRSTMDKDELAEAVEDARVEENPRASDAAKASAKKAGSLAERKRADAEQRLAAGRPASLDRNDPTLGWDAQQGGLPSTKRDLYRDDPPKYSADQLPDPEQLKAAGYKPVMREEQID